MQLHLRPEPRGIALPNPTLPGADAQDCGHG